MGFRQSRWGLLVYMIFFPHLFRARGFDPPLPSPLHRDEEGRGERESDNEALHQLARLERGRDRQRTVPLPLKH